jgi:hypothetical protein
LKIPNSDLSRSQWEHLIDEYIIGNKAYRDREILKESLLDGRPYEWIAEKHGMSARQVARIIPKLEEKLFRKIK